MYGIENCVHLFQFQLNSSVESGRACSKYKCSQQPNFRREPITPSILWRWGSYRSQLRGTESGQVNTQGIGEFSSGKTKAAKVSFILTASMLLGPALITIQSNHKCIFSKLLQKHSNVFSCCKPHRLMMKLVSTSEWKSTDWLTIFPLEPILMPTSFLSLNDLYFCLEVYSHKSRRNCYGSWLLCRLLTARGSPL